MSQNRETRPRERERESRQRKRDGVKNESKTEKQYRERGDSTDRQDCRGTGGGNEIGILVNREKKMENEMSQRK